MDSVLLYFERLIVYKVGIVVFLSMTTLYIEAMADIHIQPSFIQQVLRENSSRLSSAPISVGRQWKPHVADLSELNASHWPLFVDQLMQIRLFLIFLFTLYCCWLAVAGTLDKLSLIVVTVSGPKML